MPAIPNHHFAKEIHELLAAQGVTLNEEAIGALDRHFTARCTIVWNLDDMHQAANQVYRVLTDDEAAILLAAIQRNHDANSGVAWVTLSDCAKNAGRAMSDPEREEQAAGGYDGNPLVA
jgi:hypothetical protein